MNRIYMHYYTGNLYRVLGTVYLEHSYAKCVAYKRWSSKKQEIWVRPFNEFHGKVEWCGVKMDRFQKMEDNWVENYKKVYIDTGRE